MATRAGSQVIRSTPRLQTRLAQLAFCVCALVAMPLHASEHQPAKLVQWQSPEVTAGAVAPTLVLRLLVAADGTVKQAEVTKKRDGLAAAEEQAMEAARKFRFEPARHDGKAVDSWVLVTLPLRASSGSPRKVVVRGSDTMGEALLPAWGEALQRSKDKLSLQVEALGSSTGFAGLFDGSADLAASSRVINAQEIAFAEKLGVQLHEIFVGLDGIALVVNPQNPVRELDLETAAAIFAGRITNWRELGGSDAPIRVLGRPAYSGTHAFLQQKLLSQLGEDTKFAPSIESVEKTEQLAEAVARDANAIGYVGLAYVKPNVRALGLRPHKDSPVVGPDSDSVLNGSYPIARPLVLYMRTDSPRGTRAVVDFARSAEGQAIVKKMGFIPMPAASESFASLMPAPNVPAPEVLRIYFEPNSSNIARESNMDLMQAAMAFHGQRRILIIGNADSTGKAEDNRKLAKQRAEVVAARLRTLAKREDAIEVEVAATEHPLATNSTSDGRKVNRRVDVLVFGAPQRTVPSPAQRPAADSVGVGAVNAPQACEPGSGRRCLY